MSRALVALWLALSVLAASAAADEPDAYDKLRQRGVLQAVVYTRYPPYSYEQDGKTVGIDVDLAAALAKSLGLGLSVRAVEAGEDMDEDLRNLIWKGTALSSAVSDVMMHVGADPEYVKRQHRVTIFAPYYHESVAVALHPGRAKALANLADLRGSRIAVERGSISDLYLSGAYSGSMRDSLQRYPTTTDAVRAFVKGETDAALLGRGELQGLLKQLGGAASDVQPAAFSGLFRSQWDVGLAVKSDNTRLREALDGALKKLADSGELAAIFARYGVEYAPATGAP